MIDQIFCFFFCAKVISHQVTQPYAAKTEEIQQEEDEPLSKSPQKGGNITTNSKESSVGSDGDTDQEGLKAQICLVFKDNCQEAIKVAVCESGLRPTAVSNTQDYGIFQIHLSAHATKIPVVDKMAYLFDPTSNINLAYTIWSKQGWGPWKYSFKCHGLS